MDTFAFVIHPINPKRDVSRKYPLLGRMVSERTIDRLCPLFPPVYISEIEGIKSRHTGKEIKGWFVACPLTPKCILELPEKKVYRKIIETGRMAEKLGAQILGLGAFTSVVGDAGQTIAQTLDIPVTTGDSYTIAMAVQAVREAAQRMRITLPGATAAVVGATGAIGRVCSEMLAGDVADLLLIGRRQESLDGLQEEIQASYRTRGLRVANLQTSTRLDGLSQADLILSVTSAASQIIEPEHLKPGAVVCDVAQPRDVSARINAARNDILVIDGGMVDVPGQVDFHFNFGLPAGKAFACMAETMALALEGRFEDYTLGREITRAQVEEITSIAYKHGFRLSGFRSFERPVTQEQIDLICDNARSRIKNRHLATSISRGG